MRVLVNMPSQYGGRPSGVARVAFRLMEHLLDRGGIEIVLRSPWTREQLPLSLRDRMATITVPRPRIMVLDVLRQLVAVPAACRKHGIDVVLNVDPYGAAAGGQARVTIVHDLYFRTIPEQIGRREAWTTDLIFRLVLGRSRSVVTVSETTRRDLEQHYPFVRGRARAIPSASILDPKATAIAGLPLSPAGRGEQARSAARVRGGDLSEASQYPSLCSLPTGERGTSPDGQRPEPVPPYVLAVGNATPNKNLAILAQAVARLAAEAPGLRLVHVGEDPGETVAGALAALGSAVRVERFSRLSDGQLADLYRGALCLCVPSLAEGFCLPVLEAQSLGCPVVCADRSATPEVAGAGALLFDPADPEALAACLRRLLAEPDLRASLAERGRRNEAAYSWPETARRYEAVLRAALAEAVSAGPGASLAPAPSGAEPGR